MKTDLLKTKTQQERRKIMQVFVRALMVTLIIASGVCLAGGLEEPLSGETPQLTYLDVNSDYAGLKTEDFVNSQPSIVTSDFGEEIVFSLSDGIYVQFADGTGRRKLIDEGSYNTLVYPAWSIDGTQIAFAAKPYDSRVVDLYVANADGSNPTVILSLNTGYYQSNIQSISWSWDSEYLMFNHAYDDYEGNDYFIVCSIHKSGSQFAYLDDFTRSYSQYEPVAGSNRYAYISTGTFWDQTTRLRVSNLDGSNNNIWFDFQGVIAGFTHVCWNSPTSIYTVVRWWGQYPNREVLIRIDKVYNNTTYQVMSVSDFNASLWCPTASPDRSMLYSAELTSNTSTLWLHTFDNNGNPLNCIPKGTGFFPNWRQNIPPQSPVDSGEPDENNLPGNFTLDQNYPNPFNARTTINYYLSQANNVTLEVYDLLGKRVEILVDEHQSAGEHQVVWNADNVASGTYLYRIEVGDEIATSKMVLLK